MRLTIVLALSVFATLAYAGESSPVTAEKSQVGPDQNVESPNQDWSFHFQATTVTQGHGGFNSPYSGPNSLRSDQEIRTSLTSTLFLGRKLWDGGQIYLNPEISGGSGITDTHGLAGYSNGEIYRVDSPDVKGQISRVYFEQILGLGGETEKIDDDKNQIALKADKSRITLVGGKFSLNDFFDNNIYSHDPRTQFLNWALMDNGAWDYAADTRGYTWGFYFEFNQASWALRLATVLVPDQANQMGLDMNIANAHGNNAEFEYRYNLLNRPGKVRVMYYENLAHMGSYQEALAANPTAPDVTATRAYRLKYGYGLNFEQALTNILGLFGRWGWNDGATETWAFTEIDSTYSLGLNVKGSLWGRDDDNIGLAFLSNGLSQDHMNYLSAGGVGFIIGDGKLNYARENIIEFYYLLKLFGHLGISADYQFVSNPAYNQDRGPVSIIAGRAHYEF